MEEKEARCGGRLEGAGVVVDWGESGIGEEDKWGKGDDLGILSLIFSFYCILHLNPFISPPFVLSSTLLLFLLFAPISFCLSILL